MASWYRSPVRTSERQRAARQRRRGRDPAGRRPAVGVRVASRPAAWSLVVVDARRRPRADAVAARRAAMGARRRAAPRAASSACADPGLFWIVPFVDRVSSWIDQRTITTSFAAEQTLTVRHRAGQRRRRAVLDGARREKAALEVQDYAQAVSWAAQTALRDIIGRTTLDRSAARPRADRGRAAAADRSSARTRGASRCRRSRCATSSFPARCRTRCRARRRPRARSRRASSSARPRWRSPHSFAGGGQVVSRQPDRAAPARDEHALRGAEGEGRADADPEQRRRVDGHGRHAGRRGAAAGESCRRTRTRTEAGIARRAAASAVDGHLTQELNT